MLFRSELDAAQLRDDAVVFNIIHGTYGEDGTLQAQLDALGRSYVGSDVVASRLCIDKDATRKKLEAAGLPIPWGVAFNPTNMQDPRDLRVPTLTGLVLKPARDGSSVGLHLLASISFLLPALEEVVAELGAIPMLLEERLAGPEYTVGVIDEADGPVALPPIRITPAAESYDYESKYVSNATRYDVVDDEALAGQLRELGLSAYRVCGCRDLARVDVMAARDGSLKILEVNTLPGFTDHSLLPKAAAAAGRDFANLCLHLVDRARQRMEHNDGQG